MAGRGGYDDTAYSVYLAHSIDSECLHEGQKVLNVRKF